MSETNKAAGRGMGRERGSRGGGFGHGHGMPMEKPKDFKSSLRRLLGYLARHKAALAVVMVTAILGTVFSIFGPRILGQATTELLRRCRPKRSVFELKEISADVADQLASGECRRMRSWR